MTSISRLSEPRLERVLEKCRDREPLDRREIRRLLDLKGSEERARLFEAARRTRARYFDEKIFLYGFVYFSTWCSKDCGFCRYRKSNFTIERYRKHPEEVMEITARLAESGVHLIDLTMGEDPFFSTKGQGAGELAALTRNVKTQTGLPIMVSPGVVNGETLGRLRAAGADWYACYQETHNRSLFRRLRPHQDYGERLRSKQDALQMGFLIEEGILTGVGDSSDDVMTSLEVMKSLQAQQVRAMTFVPQEGTPLENVPAPSSDGELVVMAVMRLLLPDRLIPASLDVGGIGGLQDRLQAGANVVTSIIPPQLGLAGVSQSHLDIEEGFRTVEGIMPILERMGLKKASRDEYQQWIADENRRFRFQNRHQGNIP